MSSRLRKVYVVSYRKSGLWFTKFFKSPEQAGAFRQMIRNNSNVDSVSSIGVIYR